MRFINKKARHDYHILESFEAGVQLLGHEVKSIKMGRVELGQSFARIQNEQLYLMNTHIPAYQNARLESYNPNRNRRLLVHKAQIRSLIGKLSSLNASLIPLSIYVKNNFIKVEIGLVKSKKQFDKRRVLKEKDNLRRVEQELRGKE